MVQAVIEVLKELWDFFCQQLWSLCMWQKNTVTQSPDRSQLLSSVESRTESILGGNEAYIVATDLVAVYSEPHVSSAVLVQQLKYGDAVILGRNVDDWTEVFAHGVSGWILQELVTQEKSEVYPNCTVGVRYGSAHPDTKKIRLLLQDALTSQQMRLPLQDNEYVRFCLYKRAIYLKSYNDDMRPYTAGSWSNLFSQKSNVIITTEPRTGSVLEGVVTGSQQHFLAYVHAVQPNGTIVVSGIGHTDTTVGTYYKKECTAAAWQEWQPIFFSFI